MKKKLAVLLLLAGVIIPSFAQEFALYSDEGNPNSIFGSSVTKDGSILYAPGDLDTEDPDNSGPQTLTDPGRDTPIGEGIFLLILLSGIYGLSATRLYKNTKV
jgi:hypothetical protein